jgi:uncharacterized protein YbaR (Trm112 family)
VHKQEETDARDSVIEIGVCPAALNRLREIKEDASEETPKEIDKRHEFFPLRHGLAVLLTESLRPA